MICRFKYLFLIGLIGQEVIRFPHRKRHRQEWREKRMAETRTRPFDVALDMLAFTGMELIPILYVFTPWLNFADYALPTWASWIGMAVLAGAVWLLWRAHADLGRNWSPTLQILEPHTLVTQGVYQYIRHPIYTAVWLTGLAQLSLLANRIAGPAGLLSFLPVYLVRVAREERMMLDHFGDEYRAYMNRTGTIMPRLGK